MTAKRSPQWFVLADTHHATLYRCQTTPTQHRHIDKIDQVSYVWEGHEHGRPTPLAAKVRHNYGHNYAPPTHDEEEDEHRFVRQMIEWIGRQLDQFEIDNLVVFAPPRCIGVVREECPKTLTDRIQLREHDLINLTTDQLNNHPAIAQLSGGAAGA